MPPKNKYSYEILKPVIESCTTRKEVLTYFGIPYTGGSRSKFFTQAQLLGVDCSHLKTNYYKGPRSKISDEVLFRKGYLNTNTSRLKTRLVALGRRYECAEKTCGNAGIWIGKPLTLQLDHIDGDNSNNQIGNLRFLCPNCHSQTETYGGKKLHKIRPVNQCSNCLAKIHPTSKSCVKCRNRPQLKFEVSRQELEDLVWKMPTSEVAKLFGVSDNAIGKRCKREKIIKPPRGYWAKVYIGKSYQSKKTLPSDS